MILIFIEIVVAVGCIIVGVENFRIGKPRKGIMMVLCAAALIFILILKSLHLLSI